MRRKRTDEKLDIYRALMLPLITMFLLNLGLIATTWAWYTASISTGVNTITAGPQVNVTVTQNGTSIPQQNGYYSLSENEECKIELSGGVASNGYYALLEISDSTTSNSLINTLITPVYAESSQLNYAVKYPAENGDNAITIHSYSSQKQLRISCVWANAIEVSNESFAYDNKSFVIQHNEINIPDPTAQEPEETQQNQEQQESVMPISENSSEEDSNVIAETPPVVSVPEETGKNTESEISNEINNTENLEQTKETEEPVDSTPNQEETIEPQESIENSEPLEDEQLESS